MPKHLSDDDIREIVQKEGYELLYLDRTRTLLFIRVKCPRGHIFEHTNFHSWKRTTNKCPECRKIDYHRRERPTNDATIDIRDLLSDFHLEYLSEDGLMITARCTHCATEVTVDRRTLARTGCPACRRQRITTAKPITPHAKVSYQGTREYLTDEIHTCKQILERQPRNRHIKARLRELQMMKKTLR